MINTKHILALLLAALLLSTSMTACGGSNTEKITQENDAAETPEETMPETTDIDLLPDANYEGFDSHILSTDPACLWGYMVSIYAEEETGEPLNDFVFQRNLAIEDRYNITISNTADKDSVPTSAEAKQLALAGDDTYSIVSYGVRWQLLDAVSGCFINLHTIETIDFSHPWWGSEAGNMLTIQDKLYVGFTEMNVFDYETLTGIYVNNDMIENHNLESPYDMVRKGTWTMDAMYDMAVTAVQDLDGNGSISEGDVLGYAGGVGCFNVMMTAANQPHVLLGDDGKYTLNHGTEASIAAAEKITRLINDNTVTGYQNDQPWVGEAFGKGNALFYGSGLAVLSQVRDSEVSVGIVPEPKFDEQQTGYRTMYSSQCMTIAVPVSNGDPERTGVICEALGAYSRLPLKKVYYESILKRKAARDEETMEMLDIIVNNKYVDIGVLNYDTWGDIIFDYTEAMRNSGTEQLVSTAAANHSKFYVTLKSIEDAYAKNP